jgi:cytochrome c oxidase subunit II
VRRALLMSGVLALAGCAGPQSALDPAGPNAASLHWLGMILYIGATAVTLLVTVLMLWPFLRRRAGAPLERRHNIFLWGGGVALPSVALLGLIPLVLLTGNELRAPTASTRLTIDVTGFVYWWEMSYRLPDGARATTANELYIPAGEPVQLFLRSDDVIHSFWVPSLAGKTDMIPGRVNRMVIEAHEPGTWRGQCAEYCGAQHALMAFDVVALPRPEFDVWLQRLASPVPPLQTPEIVAGRDLFVRAGCGTCHTIHGVSDGQRGPDLTQVGARRSLAAGTFPNNIGTMAGWIAAAQHLKPGNRMPSFGHLSGEELRLLAGYLGQLR